ncbi:MAG: sigma-54-dependent Fis family transcriptional regulator [Caulobacteraceae bacterium]|nr:sigma-54-dependent Fis family transcriptional regulator [Caulobacteraceae bacterium]
MVGSVLVVDDDRDVLHAARLALAREAQRVETSAATDGLEDLLAADAYEAVLLDMNFALGDHSGRQGLDSLERVRAFDPNLSVVLMTAFGGVSLAVEALKRGAVDFVLKPWRNEKLIATVCAAAELTRCRRAADMSFDLESAERTAIQRALAHHKGNISRAAASLGLTRPALYRRLARHGLSNGAP